MLKELFNKNAVILELKATTKEAAMIEIATHLEKNKYILSKETYLEALHARESQSSTGIGEEIAIPHAQSATVLKNVVLIARAKKGIKWDSLDGKDAKYIFSIALNNKDMDKQVEVLKHLSTALINPESKVNLEKAKSVTDLMNALVVNKTAKLKAVKSGAKKIVAVTACPTGIAHTFMAADSINQAAGELGYNVKTETQGRRIENKLSETDIANADVIILAIDKGIDGMGRFNGKKVLKVSTSAAIKDSKSLISRALKGEGEVIKSAGASSSEVSGDYSWGAFKNVYKNLMGGVSRMLPFVVAGGILLGLAFLLDSGNAGGNLGATRDIAGWFAGLGKVAFGIFVPVLGAYVAYSIVGQEGLMPGLVAGLIASGGGILYGGDIEPGWANMWGRITPGIDQGVLASGSGFLGAMVGGYVAAASIVILRKYVFVNPSAAFRGVVDIVAMPVFSILITGLGMFIFQMPLAYVAYGLQKLLEVFQDHNLVVLLTMILGIMMAIDMGGPVNKVAYVFATASLGEGTEVNYQIMAAVMAAGMVPPLAIAFSALIFKDKSFSEAERESAKANWLLGAFFITEGAIPFAAKDPKRVLPTMMLASGITGLLIGLFQVGVNAPHGGIITLALFRSYLFTGDGAQIGMGIAFLLASLTAGMVAGGFALGIWKAKAVKSGNLSTA